MMYWQFVFKLLASTDSWRLLINKETYHIHEPHENSKDFSIILTVNALFKADRQRSGLTVFSTVQDLSWSCGSIMFKMEIKTSALHFC